jgi:response regulator RpfG family c-di-GMP phosphodiesterase
VPEGYVSSTIIGRSRYFLQEKGRSVSLPSEEALRQIEAGSGAQFDPTLVPLFVRAIRENSLPHLTRNLKAA